MYKIYYTCRYAKCGNTWHFTQIGVQNGIVLLFVNKHQKK